MQPLITILVPCYNHEIYISECVESIIRQQHPRLELIVINDGSTDNSAEVIARLVSEHNKKFEKFIFINRPHEGVNKALNAGLAVAKGDFVTICASDDIFLPNRFQAQLEFFSTNPNCGIVYSNGRIWSGGDEFGSQVHPPEIRKIIQKPSAELLEFILTHISPVYIPTALIKRELIADAGGYDERILTDDWVLNIRLLQALVRRNMCHGFIDIDTFGYRMHADQGFRNFPDQFRRSVEPICLYTPPEKRAEFLQRVFWQFGMGVHGKRMTPFSKFLGLEEAQKSVKPATTIQLDRKKPPPPFVYLHNPRLEVLSEIKVEPKVVVDIGCNTGASLQWIKGRYPGCKTIGVEMNPHAANIAKNHVDVLIQLPIEQISWEQYGIEPGSIDVVIMADVIEHLENPWMTLKEVRTLLSPEGMLLASIPNAQNLWLIDHLANGHWTYSNDGLLDATHLRFFTKNEIARLLKKTGYKIDSVRNNIDGRLSQLSDDADNFSLIETEKIIIKNVSNEEKIDLATLQFVICARPALYPDYIPQKRRLKIGLLTVDKQANACKNIRLNDPLALLSNYVDTIDLVKQSQNMNDGYQVREDLIEGCDLFIIQRIFPCQQTIPILEKIYNLGRPVVYETDDLLDEITPDNPMYELIKPRASYILNAIEKSNAVVVSTNAIKARYTGLNSNITVFRNQLTTDRWKLPNSNNNEPGKPVVIGFTGTTTHLSDLRLIEGAVLKALQYFGDKIKIVIWGPCTDYLRAEPNCIHINAGIPYQQYPQRLAGLGFDIGLIPLASSPFNTAKSDLKWLEFSILGIPTICSDVPSYAEAKNEGLAIAVPNNEKAWFEAIVKLVEDVDFRRRLGSAAQNHVKSKRMLDQHIAAYADFLNTLVPEELYLPPAPLLELQPLPPSNADDTHIPHEDYELWLARHRLQEVDAEVLAERMMRWTSRPIVGVLMVVQSHEMTMLAETIDSLQQQLYPHWKLIVISDQPSPDEIFNNSDILGWLQIDTVSDEALVAHALTEVVTVANVELCCMVPPGTRFESQTFVLIADYFQRHPEWSFAYCDHDYVRSNGSRLRPAFKPDFNLDLLRSTNYIGDAVFFRADLIQSAGGVHPYPFAECYELALRLLDVHGEKSVGHVAEPLMSFPLQQDDVHVKEASLRVAVEAHLARRNTDAEVCTGLLPGTLRVTYRHAQHPLVSIIIPNRDKIEVLAPCLDSLFNKTLYPNFEVIVVDNQSEDPDIFELYKTMEASHGERFRVVRYDAPFNFAAQINLGAEHSHGELLLFLNNDCEIIQPEWLDRLVSHALRPEVGAVGPMLIAPETGQVQQAGILLGATGGLLSVASHAFSGYLIHDEGYMSRLQVDQNYSAVTAACMLIRRETFSALNGFDAKNFAVLMNDVDFCLRIAATGLKNVWTPYARVVHHEGRSLKGATSDPENILRTLMRDRQEFRAMLKRWQPILAHDPAGNRHLSLKDSGMHLETLIPVGWDTELHDRNRVLGFPLIGGSGEYRVVMPLRGLAQAGLMHTEQVPPLGGKIPEISVVEMTRLAPDTLLLHSTINTLMQEALPIWKEFLPNLRVVFGLDDRMDQIPEKSSVYMGHKRSFSDIRLRMRKLLKLCDAAVVSTEPLAEMLKGMVEEIHVIPNALERAVWEPLRPRRQYGSKPRIGWVGAQQHRGDLELIHDVVKATANDVEWVFMGMWLPEFDEFVHERHPFVAFDQYPEKMASLNLDLAIAPLEINEFNEAKSNLRLLEYGILGYPVICTDIFPYQTGDAPVTRLPNDAKRWIEAIHDKVGNLDALAREGDQLRQWVLENYMLDQHIHAWYEALTPHA